LEEARQRKREQALAQAAAPQTIKSAGIKATGPTNTASTIASVKKAISAVSEMVTGKKPATATGTSVVNSGNHGGPLGSLSSNTRPVANKIQHQQLFDVSVVNESPHLASSHVTSPTDDRPVNVVPEIVSDGDDVTLSQASSFVPTVVTASSMGINIIEPEPEPEPKAETVATTPSISSPSVSVVVPVVSVPLREVAVPVEETVASMPVEDTHQYPMAK
jgi:hypothetical protein